MSIGWRRWQGGADQLYQAVSEQVCAYRPRMLIVYDEWLFVTDTPQPLFHSFDGLLTGR
jgi:hypothetical protein